MARHKAGPFAWEHKGDVRLCENAAVFASEAKQSIKTSCKPGLLGLLRFARNDSGTGKEGVRRFIPDPFFRRILCKKSTFCKRSLGKTVFYG
jgi:hypothetical protein